jgi:hypothetical protein
MPKCDIFDRSDLHDFTPYTVVYMGGGDLGVKIKKNIKNIFLGVI